MTPHETTPEQQQIIDRVLRLYVWPQFSPDYTAGLAFAIATTEEQARQAIEQRLGFTPADWGPVEIHDATDPVAYARTGGG
jgi:hypothetical protein